MNCLTLFGVSGWNMINKAGVSESSGGGSMWSISPADGEKLRRCIDKNCLFDFQGEAACLTFAQRCTLSSGRRWLSLLIPASLNTQNGVVVRLWWQRLPAAVNLIYRKWMLPFCRSCSRPRGTGWLQGRCHCRGRHLWTDPGLPDNSDCHSWSLCYSVPAGAIKLFKLI